MTFTKITFCILYLFAINVESVGQRPPVKYGKVDEKEAALTNYQGADAVILCDYGEYKFDGKTGVVYFEFTRHLRIKILTEAGLRYATQQIHYYDLQSASYYPYNETYTLRAQTLNVNAKGKVVESKVKARYTVITKPDENLFRRVSNIGHYFIVKILNRNDQVSVHSIYNKMFIISHSRYASSYICRYKYLHLSDILTQTTFLLRHASGEGCREDRSSW